jgi:hypothetical protein
VLPCGALSICHATKARVRGPTQARPEIDSGARVPVIAVDAVRRIASGPRSRTTAPFAPRAPRLRDSSSTEPRPSAAWFSRLARNPKTVSRVAGISRVAAISRRAPNRVETPAARPRLTIRPRSAAVSRGAGPPMPSDAVVSRSPRSRAPASAPWPPSGRGDYHRGRARSGDDAQTRDESGPYPQGRRRGRNLPRRPEEPTSARIVPCSTPRLPHLARPNETRGRGRRDRLVVVRGERPGTRHMDGPLGSGLGTVPCLHRGQTESTRGSGRDQWSVASSPMTEH